MLMLDLCELLLGTLPFFNRFLKLSRQGQLLLEREGAASVS